MTPESYTGAAYIFIEEATGDNAIIISPGAASLISPADIDANAALIRSAVGLRDAARAAARRGDPRRSRSPGQAGVTTILNPAPRPRCPMRSIALCDYVTPNETEAEG